VVPVVVVVAAVAGGMAALALRGGAAPAAAPRTPALGTATVVRTNLDQTASTSGTLGYSPIAPLINQLQGTYTSLPAPGATVVLGGTLYRVDDEPVVLMAGTTPAWRPFGPNMTPGPDVRELESNLIALGDAHGLLDTASDQFTPATTAAIERWQAATGRAVNGQIGLGQVVFLPAPLLVGAAAVQVGQPAGPGDIPFAVSSSTRTVTVPLGPDAPPATVGETVSITLPDSSTTPGTVTAITTAPPAGNSSGGGGNGGSSSGAAATQAVITPTDPAATGSGTGVVVQVSLTVQSADHVLAAPITSLLALADGGYGVEVVEPSGGHHLVGVTTGLYTGTMVQISGAGIAAGTKVAVAQ
jgi:hypothetical protein